MKTGLIAFVFLAGFAVMSLKDQLADTQWKNITKTYYSTIGDTLSTTTVCVFSDDKIEISVSTKEKTETIVSEIKKWEEHGDIFKLEFRKKSKKGFFYGYLSSSGDSLSIMPSKTDVKLDKETIDSALFDSYWLIFEKEKVDVRIK